MKKVICAVLPVFLLCGCFDSRDVKDVAIVMGISALPGEETYFKTITQTVIPKGLSKEGDGDSFENFPGEGNHFGECIENTALKCGKYMYLSHTSALLIHEDIAKDGIYEILDYFMRDSELRSNLTVAVVKSEAEKIMETESGLLKVPVSGVASLIRKFRETSLGSAPRVFDMVSDIMKKDAATLVPILALDGENVTVNGSAVFKNGKMTGEISNGEARGVLWLLGKVENGIMTIDFGETTLDIKILQSKSHIYKEETRLKAEIKCNIGILRDNYDIVTAYGTEAVKQKISETIKSETDAALLKLQSMNADVYGIMDMAYKKGYPPVPFGDISIEVSAECRIKEAGGILKSARSKI